MEQLLELARERKLDRVGATYAVVAWIVVQAASIALPAFSAPASAMRWLILVAMAGFPLALAMAWVLAGRSAAPSAVTARPFDRRDGLLLGLIGLVAVLLVVQLTSEFSGRRIPMPADAGTHAQALSSIAVLPFENLSGDAKKVYFSDGIADQLISVLARTPALRVAARTSSFAFRGKDVDIKTIARALNVRTVLEGSVREDGNRVRIAAELVDATNGFQIWSDSYDRDLTNILSLQDEIAGAIARALSARFWGGAVVTAHTHAKAKAIDPEAYRDYLQGQFYLAQRTREGIARAISLFTRVTQRAPDYADGFAALADAYSVNALNYATHSDIPPALATLKQSLALDPNNVTALIVQARLALLQWQWRKVAENIKRLEKLHVNTAASWRTRSVFFDYMGWPDLARPAEENAIRSDPLSFIDHYNLALYMLVVKRYGDAVKAAADAAALQPGNPELLALQCRIAALRNQRAEAVEFLAQLEAQSKAGASPADAANCQFHLDIADNKFAAAKSLVDGAAATYPASGINASDLAVGYASTGDFDNAIKWFRRAFDSRDPQMLPLPYLSPEFTKLYADPRWKALRAEPAIRDWEAARTEIAAEFQRGE